MNESQSISLEVFKDMLKQSIVAFDNERDHPHAKCQNVMQETYHDLQTNLIEIKHKLADIADDVHTIKQRQNDLDNKLIMLQQITDEHTGKIKTLEEWKAGIDGVIKTLRNRLWAAIWSALCLAALGAYNFFRENTSFTFK